MAAMVNLADSQIAPSYTKGQNISITACSPRILGGLAGGIAGPALPREIPVNLPSVRRKRMERRDPKQVEAALFMPDKLLMHPNPRHLGTPLDSMVLTFDRGRVCAIDDPEVEATRSIAAATSRALRELPRDHLQWAEEQRRANDEEQVFKDLRAIRMARKPLVPEVQKTPRGGCGFEACARARGDPELKEVTTAALSHPCGPGPCFSLDKTPRRGFFP
eukprot:TRINITY_DN67866_c0_g1_i1.p1 TRINITY_DN67866_c0_g1~~TRINITY_DN67866_c0_g1_i1.p1  ORF type:complete len:232 (+),score=49.94 TRINITY_DN67866_c0_g1_i1:42-698(+)